MNGAPPLDPPFSLFVRARRSSPFCPLHSETPRTPRRRWMEGKGREPQRRGDPIGRTRERDGVARASSRRPTRPARRGVGVGRVFAARCLSPGHARAPIHSPPLPLLLRAPGGRAGKRGVDRGSRFPGVARVGRPSFPRPPDGGSSYRGGSKFSFNLVCLLI